MLLFYLSRVRGFHLVRAHVRAVTRELGGANTLYQCRHRLSRVVRYTILGTRTIGDGDEPDTRRS